MGKPNPEEPDTGSLQKEIHRIEEVYPDGFPECTPFCLMNVHPSRFLLVTGTVYSEHAKTKGLGYSFEEFPDFSG
jgi:hypothetical protein